MHGCNPYYSVMTTTLSTQRILTPQQVAKRFQVSQPTVSDWCNSGLMPAVNLARSGATQKRWRMSEQDIADFEQRHRVRRHECDCHLSKLPGWLSFDTLPCFTLPDLLDSPVRYRKRLRDLSHCLVGIGKPITASI